MSIVLVAAMGLAAFVLGFLSPTTNSSLKSPPVATDTPFTGRLVQIDR
ncbi:MAG TPA: hypothetical protein VED87_10400 [Methylocystis sp.]|nr:hypothetical protein [Methylocystis sp.]